MARTPTLLPLRAGWLTALLLGGALVSSVTAQDDALVRFERSFADAVALASRGRPMDLQQAEEAFAVCQGLVPELPEERRAQAAFFVAVRKAGLRLRSPRPEVRAQAVPMLSFARQQARGDGVYGGSYRALLLVQLWQAQPGRAGLRALPADDRAFLLAEDLFAVTLARARYLHGPCRILRCLLRIGTAEELTGLRDLHDLESSLGQAVATGNADTGDGEWHRVCLHELAGYYLERRMLDRAEVYAGRLSAAEARPIRALLALQREDHPLARKLARELIGEGRAEGHQILAEALEADGEHGAALLEYERFLAVTADPENRAAAWNGKGDCLLRLGRLDDAEAAYRQVQALTAGGGVGLRAEAAETEKDLGRLQEARGDPTAAFRHFATAAAATEEVRSLLARDPFGGSWLRFHGDQLTAVDGALRVATAAAADPMALLALMELFRGRSALDAVAAPGNAVDDQDLRALLRRRLDAREPAQIDAIRRDLEALRARSTRVPAVTSPLLELDLRIFLGAVSDRLLLAYWVGRDAAWLIWGRGSSLRLQRLGEGREALVRAATAFAAVADPAADAAPALSAAAAFFLPGSVAAEVAAAGRVLFIPDTELTRLPLEALPCRGAPLGLDRAVERAASLSVAARLLERGDAGAGGGLTVVDSAGQPELERRLGLQPLEFSAREGDLVAQSHGRVVRLRGADATLDGLRKCLGPVAPDVLHLSAHAVDCADFPSQSLLLLSDGPASMVALGTLPLHGSLLVFSACSAAIGEQRGQEGVVGLVEGALGAGARAVVAPLCAVNQQATADLMGQFHHHLAAGLDPALALARARSTLAASANYAHPHYWAPFCAFAVTRAPPGSGLPPCLVLVLGVGALVALLVALARRKCAS